MRFLSHLSFACGSRFVFFQRSPEFPRVESAPVPSQMSSKLPELTSQKLESDFDSDLDWSALEDSHEDLERGTAVSEGMDFYRQNALAAARVDFRNDEFAQGMRADRAMAGRYGVDLEKDWIDGSHKLDVVRHAERVDGMIAQNQAYYDDRSNIQTHDPILDARVYNGAIQSRAHRDVYAASLRDGDFRDNPYAAQLSRSVKAGDSGLLNLAGFARDAIHGNPYQEVHDDSPGSQTASALRVMNRNSRVLAQAGFKLSDYTPAATPAVEEPATPQKSLFGRMADKASGMAKSALDTAKSVGSAVASMASTATKTVSTLPEKAKGLWGRAKSFFGRTAEA
ncbi:MAG: hypothetical protein AAB551_02720 [Patescibacteria group bacterium]